MNRTSRIVPLLAAATIVALVRPAGAQPQPVNGMRPADVRRDAIVGATVVTAPGERLESATIVLRQGVIEAVGVGVAVPAEARVWSGKGLTVYPGLIDAAVLVKPPVLPDAPGRHWNDHVHPELRMSDQPPLDAALRKKLRSLGFTAAAVYPSQGIFRGSGTVVALADSAEHQRAYRDRAAMAVGFDRAGSWAKPATPGSLMGVIALIRQTILDARWHQACRAVYAEHPEGNEPPLPAVALEALDGVIERRQPVLFDVASELDLLRAYAIAREFEFDAIMLGGGYELRRLDEIAALGVPVIVPVRFPDPPDVSTLHRADDVSLREMVLWEQAPTNPRRLVAAGVPIALTTHRLAKRDAFPGAVRTAIKHGLSEDDALAALTTGPAEILGLGNVLGTIEPGKAANLVVVEGSLFDKKAKIRDTWINGRRHEINPAPHDPLLMAGVLRLDDGRAIPLDLDTKKPSATFMLGDETKVKAKKVVVLKDQVTIVAAGSIVGAGGYVRLSGVVTNGSITGTAALPDGTRMPFTIARDHDIPETREANGEPANGASGDWEVTLADPDGDETLSFTCTLEVDAEGNVTGTGDADDQPMDLSGGSYDAGTGRLELALADPAGRDVALTGTVVGAAIDGEAIRDGVTLVVSARRPAGAGGREDFEMPPDDLARPLGAYGVASAPPVQDVVITNATIWTGADKGVIEGGTMLVRRGKIVGVFANGNVPRIAINGPTIDLEGRHVTAGLIDCHSHTGISGGVNEFPEANTAEVRIGDVVNPDDINWYRQLAGGLTAANLLHGSANPIGGQNCVVKLKWGGSAADLPIADAPGGIKFALGENVKRSSGRYPDTRMGVETFIRDAFTAAVEYRAERERYDDLRPTERRRTMPPRPDLEMDALVEILDGKRLVHCHSYRQDEILMLIRVAEHFGFTIGTFQHVLEGYKVAEAIEAHGAGASSFSDWWAYKVEVMDAIPSNGALMHEVGVLVSFNSDSSELARRMNTEAAKAVRYGGVDPHEALKFVTLNPARQLGIDHRTGSLEPGKDADFVIWSGPPLSTYSVCEQTWIEGRRYFDRDDDLARRAVVRAERGRLTQKLLARAHGATKGAGAGTTAHRPGDAFADLSEEDLAWLEEQVRLGRDPAEARPGDCCDGALWHRLREEH
ncbi:MAG: amidohydrolase family protein [Planctomycetes bacterium]|nr:amidohydrolase family protein [Planctomycetota bacterium]